MSEGRRRVYSSLGRRTPALSPHRWWPYHLHQSVPSFSGYSSLNSWIVYLSSNSQNLKGLFVKHFVTPRGIILYPKYKRLQLINEVTVPAGISAAGRSTVREMMVPVEGISCRE